MPANQSPPPAAPAQPFSNPTVSPPFSGALKSPTQSVSESPVIQSSATKSSSISPPSAAGKSNRKGLLGIIVLIVLLIGAGVGGLFYLRNQQQDIPRTTVTPSPAVSTARITLDPPSGALDGGVEQKVNFFLELSSTPVNLSAINFTLNFGGSIPADITFVADPNSPLPAPQPTITNTESGKTVEVSFPFEQNITVQDKKIALGALQFTSLATGQLNIRFDSGGSKVLTSPNSIDILRPPSIVSYTFQVPLEASTSEASESATTENATESAQLAQAQITPTATVTVAASAASTVKPSATPTVTKAASSGVGGASASATPTKKATATPTTAASESASRSNSQPAQTQSLPVSGDSEMTMVSIGLGILLLISGLILWPKLRKPKHLSDQ